MRILLFCIVCLGLILRFYELDWGQGLFTHPDEYHIVGSVNQLFFPTQMHPHFFSYGTVIIYLIYFTKEVIAFINSLNSLFIIHDSLFIIGRFYSALFSTLSIIVVYKICRFFMDKRFAYIAALLMGLIPGLIQQAHFATPESTQIFFLLSCLLFMIKFVKQNKITHLIFASIFFGLALGVKVSSIVFVVPLLVGVVICHPELVSGSHSFRFFVKHGMAIIKLVIASITIALVTFAIVTPFVFLDFPAFRGNLEYEGGLAIGKFPVFYTRQFIQTIPVLFQLEKIFPYVLGLPLLIAGIGGFLLSFIHLGRWPRLGVDSSEVNARGILLILIIAFLSLFISNAFLFAKWTRFIAPTFPFFAIFAAFLLNQLGKKMRFTSYVFAGILVFTTTLWTIAFFSIYTNPDVRITASKWLESYAKEGSSFLVEGGNTVDLPLSGNFQRTSLHFYAMEDDLLTREKIADALYSSDYFLLQSRRVFMNHQRLKDMFPKTAKFYNRLFNGELGFEQVQQFRSYPRLSLFGFTVEFADENAEETWSAFDHPVIRIFEKTKQLSKDDYAKFLEN